MEITKDQLIKLEQRLGELHLMGITQGTITKDQTPVIARYILDNIESIETGVDLRGFLERLIIGWPVFAPLLKEFEQNGKILEDQELADQMIFLARDGKIEDALKLVKEGGI
jgi:hypothetical protein